MLSEMDWKTPIGKVRLGDHWRFFLCNVVGASVGTAICSVCFPDTMWLLRFWCGSVTGVSVATFAGVWWQTRDPLRRQRTSGRWMATTFAAFVLFSAVALFVFVPDMAAQEQALADVRHLARADISSIIVTRQGGRPRKIRASSSIDAFVEQTGRARLFYPSHEGSAEDLQIEIYFEKGGSMSYAARIPEHHRDDLSLEFHGYAMWNEIIIPDGRVWLDSLPDD